MFEEAPLGLKVVLPLRHTSWALLIGIDSRVGHVIASLEVDSLCSGVKVALETLEREVTDNKNSLSAQLTLLQLAVTVCVFFNFYWCVA